MSAAIPATNGHDRLALDGLHVGDLFRRYRPQEELGRGPVATVYRAVDEESKRAVALKLFDARFRQEPRFAVRFRHHLKAVVALNHAHLIAVRDYGLAGDHFYIVTDLVEGLNLATLLAERGALAPAAAAGVARQVCDALAAAHEHGLVHRNLKPENVLLGEDGQARVADVGLSGLLSESGLSQTSVMLHGAAYMAPEQGRGQTAGPAADIYSAGVILFEMLTGQPPFISKDVWQVVQMHLYAEPPSPGELNPDVPPELAAVVARALRKEPAGRFATADEMATALAPLASGAGAIEWTPALPQTTGGRRRMRLPVVFNRGRDWAGRLAAKVTTTDGRRRLPRRRLLLGLQFIASFTVAFLLLLALTGILAGSPPPDVAEDEAHRRLIAKPLPATATPTPAATPAATPTPEPSPTVAAAGQPPANRGGQGGEGGGPPGDGGPPPWAGGPPPWAGDGGPPGERGGRGRP